MTPSGCLSSLNRHETFLKMEAQRYDLIIIGGGITGAGIALDASKRGLRTLLLEKQDYAAGTSSRSTKLIHGGLRYLQQFRLKEVAAVGYERKLLFLNAPHRVYREKMLLPFYKNGTFGKYSASIGLWIYDLLAGVSKKEKRKMLSASETENIEPLLGKDGLLGGGSYYEYRTDDALLVLDVLKKSVSFGAECLNYCEVKDFVFENSTLTGVTTIDLVSGKTIVVHGDCIVNATGPWSDLLAIKEDAKRKKILHHTKGVHLVVPHAAFPLKQSVYFPVFKKSANGNLTSDGRMVFAIPSKGITYIGTTDTSYQGNLEHPRVTKEDVDYLLNATNQLFPSIHLKQNQVVSSWAGIRPLIQQEGKKPSEISRKDEILISENGLITIAGGKLTGYRKMAEQVTDLAFMKISRKKNIPFVRCSTKRLSLIDKRAETDLKTKIKYSTEREGMVTISDYFIRRTGMLYFEKDKIENLLHTVADEMQRILRWTEEEKQKQLNDFKVEFDASINFI